MQRKTLEEFINQAKEVHGNKYDYLLVEYKNNRIKVKITCFKHGIFEQSPSNHINLRQGCPRCLGLNKKSTNEFIEKAKLVHGDKYDYSLVDYINIRTKVRIICLEHGIFDQISKLHLNGHGCPICSNTKKLTTEEFIKKADKIHNNKYDYSLAKYKNNKTKVNIICHKHGIFLQQPDKHLFGVGCPKCNESKGEIKIVKLLNENNIQFERQKTFIECKNKNLLPFDFYIPALNTCIEFDGQQHFISVEFFGGEKAFEQRKINDKIKTEYCMNNNIKLIRISYFENIYNKIKSLLSEAINID